MLEILVDEVSPRLKYVSELLFEQLLGLPCSLVPRHKAGANTAQINYSPYPTQKTPTLYASPLLFQKGISKTPPPITTSQTLKGWYPASQPGFIAPIDLLASTFIFLTQYTTLQNGGFDQHNRHTLPEEALKKGLFNHPWINEYAEILRKTINHHFPHLKPKKPKFDYLVTVDIDHPWRFLHKPKWVQLGSDLRNRIKDPETLHAAREAKKSGKDPFDTYSEIQRICPPEKTLYFFLTHRTAKQDSRFTLKNPELKKLIQKLEKGDFYRDAGIHPAYTSFLDPETIQNQTKDLAQTLDRAVTISRQHYLRYKNPETFRSLIKAGIKTDFSIGPINNQAFPTGYSGPGYFWYDLENEEKTQLKLVPAQIMDRTLKDHLKLNPEAAILQLRKQIEITRRTGGKFVIILHNETFSEFGEWKGWKRVIEMMMEELRR